jgi:hypothetical protein
VRPRTRRRSFREVSLLTAHLLSLAGEVVVRVEAVRLDDEVANARIVREGDLHDRLDAARAATLIEDVSDGLGAEGSASVRVADRAIERGSTVEIEQTKKAGGCSTEMAAVESDLAEEGLGRRADGEESVSTAMLAPLSLLGGERREMSLVLELLSGVVRARMARDLVGAVENADDRLGGDDRERPPNMRVRDRIVVAIEAHVGRLAGGDGAYEIG